MFWIGFASGAATVAVVAGIFGWVINRQLRTLIRLTYGVSTKGKKL